MRIDYAALDRAIREYERCLADGWPDDDGWQFATDLAQERLADCTANLRATASASRAPSRLNGALRLLLDVLPDVRHPKRTPRLILLGESLHVPAIVGERLRAVRDAMPVEPAPWRPSPGFVSVMEIQTDPRFRKNGKNPPRSTIEKWEVEAPTCERNPATREAYYPEKWVTQCVEHWHPKKRRAYSSDTL